MRSEATRIDIKNNNNQWIKEQNDSSQIEILDPIGAIRGYIQQPVFINFVKVLTEEERSYNSE